MAGEEQSGSVRGFNIVHHALQEEPVAKGVMKPSAMPLQHPRRHTGQAPPTDWFQTMAPVVVQVRLSPVMIKLIIFIFKSLLGAT